MLIRTRASLPPSLLLTRPAATDLPPPLDRDQVAFYHKGRVGVWHAARSLKRSGGPGILVPSYNCGSEIEALRAAGATPIFYRVDGSAHVDVDDVAAALDERCAAVYLTHYFGFAQPGLEAITELCHARGAVLIEDCAHALYSTHAGRPLGTFGDVAIFSLPKILPVPDGGAILAANGGFSLPCPPKRPPVSRWADELLISLTARAGLHRARPVRAASRFVLAPLARAAIRAGPRPGVPGDVATETNENLPLPFDPRTTAWGPSPVTRAILRRTPHELIRTRRRANYQILLEQLGAVPGLSLIRPELTAGACPFCLPVVTDNPVGLRAHLARSRILVDVLWPHVSAGGNGPEPGEAEELRRGVVALPVHQDLDQSELGRIAAAVRDWSHTR